MKWLLIASGVLYLFSFKRPILVAALCAELVYVAWRGISLGRLPLIGPHDTIAFFSCSIGLMALPFIFTRALAGRPSITWGCGVLAGFFALVSLPFPTLNMPLPPILDTYWFELHVALAFFGYALFGVAAVLGAAFLMREDRGLLYHQSIFVHLLQEAESERAVNLVEALQDQPRSLFTNHFPLPCKKLETILPRLLNS